MKRLMYIPPVLVFLGLALLITSLALHDWDTVQGWANTLGSRPSFTELLCKSQGRYCHVIDVGDVGENMWKNMCILYYMPDSSSLLSN